MFKFVSNATQEIIQVVLCTTLKYHVHVYDMMCFTIFYSVMSTVN